MDSPAPSPHRSLPPQQIPMDFDLSDFTHLSSGAAPPADLDRFLPAAAQDGAASKSRTSSSEGRYPPPPSRESHHSPSGSTHHYPCPAEPMSRAQASSSNHHSPSQQHQQHQQQQQPHHQQHHPQPAATSRASSVHHHPLHSVFSAHPDSTHTQQQQQQDDNPRDINTQLSQLLMTLSGSASPSTRSGFDTASHDGAAQLSLQDIQRLLAEKEQSDRLQTLQTALLRQQLEVLQRAQQNTPAMPLVPPQQLKETPSQPSLQRLLTMLGSSPAESRSPAPMDQGQQQSDTHHFLANLLGVNGQQSANNGYSKILADSASLLAQYGVLTPPASGGLDMLPPRQQPFMSPLHIPQGASGSGGANGYNGLAGTDGGQPRTWDPQMRNQYTSLESPAITPASVFSNMSLGGMSSADQFFSPLTSPALHPTPSHPFYSTAGGSKKPHGKSTTPSASPLALNGKPGPLPRKNRSTTAEARANRSRPSPLIKPTIGGGHKKKKEVAAVDGSSSKDGAIVAATSSGLHARRRSTSEDGKSGATDGTQSVQTHAFSTFLPLTSGSIMSMGACPSEGAASTPSPIDLGNDTSMGPPAHPADYSKPLTPGSIMGIASSVKGSSSRRKRLQELKVQAAGVDANASLSANGSATKGKGRASQQVSFATGPRGDDNEGDDAEDEEAKTAKGGGGSSGDGGGAPESRRTSHKAAEQKRRDSLKYCFDELRCMLPPITLDEDAPGGSSLGPDGLSEDEEAEGFDRSEVMDAEFSQRANRAISKVALLRHSNEWIVRLRNRLARRDHALALARAEIESLHTILITNGVGVGVGVNNSAFPAMDSFRAAAGVVEEASTGQGHGQQQQLAQHPPPMDWA